MADGAWLVTNLSLFIEDDVRQVNGDHRRNFRAAVAFQNRHAVFFLKSRCDLFAQLFSTGDDITQRGEFLSCTASDVPAVERRRADEQRGTVFMNRFTDGLRVGA